MVFKIAFGQIGSDRVKAIGRPLAVTSPNITCRVLAQKTKLAKEWLALEPMSWDLRGNLYLPSNR